VLGQLAGTRTEVIIPERYSQSIAALCQGEADLAWLAIPAYLVACRECKARALFSVAQDGIAYHRAEILVQTNEVREKRGAKPLDSLDDLGGLSIAFTTPYSFFGYLLPKAEMVSRGITLGEEVFVGGDAQAVLTVYRGEVDAAATYWRPLGRDGTLGDGRALLEESYRDAGDVLRILWLSEPVPNSPLVVRRELPREVYMRLSAALLELTRSEEGRSLLRKLYRIDGLVPVNDADYVPLFQAFDVLHLDPRRFLEKLSP